MRQHQPSLFSNNDNHLNGETSATNTRKRKQKPPNEALILRIDKEMLSKRDVLAPCIKEYRARFNQPYEPIQLLDNLTEPLLKARDETRAIIEERFSNKWGENLDEKNRSVANSLKRAAGTNYQTLVSYAIARYLLEVGSAWYIQNPIPKNFKQELTIIFTSGIPITPEEDQAETEENDEEDNSLPSTVRVQPDVDLLLRNSGWLTKPNLAEPVIMLSIKTSLVDRAGMAARWKIYFDQVTNPCPHRHLGDCAYRKLGIEMENPGRYIIQHGIVTANIYKLYYSDPRYRKGELNSGQTRSNTYMFDLKLTTRDDSEAETPSDWKQFRHIAKVLEDLSAKYGFPN